MGYTIEFRRKRREPSGDKVLLWGFNTLYRQMNDTKSYASYSRSIDSYPVKQRRKFCR